MTKICVWWLFWNFSSHIVSSCRGNGCFVDYESEGVTGHLHKNSAFSIFFLG